MGRKNFDCVIKLQKLLVQSVIHHRSHHLRCIALRARQIRPADIADEESIAGQNLLRLIGDFSVDNEYADALRRVTRSFQEAQFHSSNR